MLTKHLPFTTDGNGCDFGELTEESRRKVKQHLRENIRKL